MRPWVQHWKRIWTLPNRLSCALNFASFQSESWPLVATSSSDGIATSRSWNAATPFWKVAVPGRCCLLVLNTRTNSPSWQALQNTWWPWVCSWTLWGPLLRRCIPPPRRTFVGTSVTASPAPRASSESAERGTREKGGGSALWINLLKWCVRHSWI